MGTRVYVGGFVLVLTKEIRIMTPLFASRAGGRLRDLGFPPRKRSGRSFGVVPALPVQLRYASAAPGITATREGGAA